MKQLQTENEQLRDAIEKATKQLENLDETIAVFTCGNKNLEKSCNESNRKIFRLESDKIKLQLQLTEAHVQSAKKIEALESLLSQVQYNTNHDLQEAYNDSIHLNYRLECEKQELRQRLLEFQAQSTEKIQSLENFLSQYQAKAFINQQQQTEQRASREIGCCTDCTENIDESTLVTQGKCQADVCFNDLKSCIEAGVETNCVDCKTGSVTPLRAEEIKLEEVVHELQSSVSKMIVSECQIKQDKARIAELETQLSCAWRTKDCEVEAARTCREQEIFNLKQLIDTLVNNLENEKQRSQNLQKAVDSYHDTVDTIKESEDRFREEVLGQKRTIQNLQQALVQTKHNLEDLQQRSNIECEQHSLLVEKLIMIVSKAEKEIQVYVEQCETFANIIDNLRDENLALEETLFYNHQDLEMYEMRLAKYQLLYNQVESQCGTLKKELQLLEVQKTEKESFVQDLSDNLSECQLELKELFSVLNEEKLEKVDQSEQINELQRQLHLVSEKLNNTLNNLEHEIEKNDKLTQSLAKSQNVTATIKNEAMLAHEKLQEAAMKMANNEQRIIAFGKQINEYQTTIDLLQQDQNILKQHLELAQLQLTNRCTECDKFSRQITHLQKLHEEESTQFNDTISNLNKKVEEMEHHCEKHCQELDSSRSRVIDLQLIESKILQDLIDKETKFHTQINQYQSEQERLIMVVNSLEDEISRMNSQLNEKDHILESLKSNIAGQENREVREKQEEIIRLKNEINSLIQSQVLLKSDNEKLQMQVAHVRSSLEANDEKQKMIITELEACLSELQNDKDFIVRKNEQLIGQIQSLQEVCNSKAESLMQLELELTETKFTRDSLCNESRQVIDHVKCWLEEQRKINLDLNHRIKTKNDVIVKLKQEKKNLMGRLKQMTTTACDSSAGTHLSSQKSNSALGSNFNRQQQQPYSMQMIHSPPPQRQVFWSMGSVDSTPCSIIDDSDWEGENSEDQCPQVWIQRVENLTEELQRSNRYWKNKMTDQEYSVSRDK